MPLGASEAVVGQLSSVKRASLVENVICNGIGLKHRATSDCFGCVQSMSRSCVCMPFRVLYRSVPLEAHALTGTRAKAQCHCIIEFSTTASLEGGSLGETDWVICGSSLRIFCSSRAFMAIITSQSSPDLSAVACKAKEGGPFIMPLGASEAVVGQLSSVKRASLVENVICNGIGLKHRATSDCFGCVQSMSRSCVCMPFMGVYALYGYFSRSFSLPVYVLGGRAALRFAYVKIMDLRGRGESDQAPLKS